MSGSLKTFLGEDEGDERKAAPSETGYPKDLAQLHTKLIGWFEEAERGSLEEREQAERARDYKDGYHWTEPERRALRSRGQPEITINYISRKVALLMGMERKARTDPKSFPRDPAEEERADAATQALRYISDDNDFSVVRSAVYENMLVEGFGGIELGLEDDGNGGADIRITHVGWERIWHDPHSRAIDFSDARYLGLVIWMDRAQVEEMYPDADEEVIGDSFSSLAGSTFDDRPSSVAWSDNQRQRTRIVQCHWSERGEWWTCTYSRAGILSDPQKSRFLDRRGKSACSLILQSAYVDRENRRYGMVHDLLSEQDEINKRRSKALHLLSVRSVIAEQGSVKDVDYARREVAKPDGYVEVTPGMKFEILDGAQLAAGQFQLLQHATQEMQASGPNASMSGTDPRELSGRAILAQQAGGMAQNEPLADSLRMWSRRVYEMAWMAARKSWTAGKWVRVTDDLGSTKWVGINRPVTVQDELAAMPEQQRMMAMQQMQLMPDDPRLKQVIRVENDITDLDVDITIEEGIDVPAMQAEQFQTLVQLAGMQPGLIPGDVLIAASGLKNKDQLLERMKQHMEAQQAKEQEAAPLMKRHAEAEVAGKEAKAAADAALAKERNIAAVRGIHDVHAEFSAPPYGQPHVAPDPPSAPGTVGPLPMAAHARGGLIRRNEPMPAPRTTLGGQGEVDPELQRMIQAQQPIQRFMQPEYGDPRSFGDAGPVPAPGATPGGQDEEEQVQRSVSEAGPMRPPQSWRSLLPRYQEIDPNFREFGTGDAGRMPFVNRRLGLGDQLSGGDPPLYPTPPGELPPTADRNTLPPGYAPPSYWSPMQMQADPRWPQTVTPAVHATGGPIAQMAGNDPPGPDDGWITAKAGEYVLNQGAVAKYGQPLLDAINAGAIDPKVLELAAGHAAADLRAKHAKAAIDEAKIGSESARTNDLMHSAVLKVAQVRQIHHMMTHPQPTKTR